VFPKLVVLYLPIVADIPFMTAFEGIAKEKPVAVNIADVAVTVPDPRVDNATEVYELSFATTLVGLVHAVIGASCSTCSWEFGPLVDETSEQTKFVDMALEAVP
jgi:hypothetical protein